MTSKGYYALCFKTRASLGAHHENLNRLYYQQRRCSPMTLDSGNVRFMRIFAVVLKIYVNFPDFMPAPLYYVYTYLTTQEMRNQRTAHTQQTADSRSLKVTSKYRLVSQTAALLQLPVTGEDECIESPCSPASATPR